MFVYTEHNMKDKTIDQDTEVYVCVCAHQVSLSMVSVSRANRSIEAKGRRYICTYKHASIVHYLGVD